jgi:ribosomal protein S18 acetylase RimI-like enzyme
MRIREATSQDASDIIRLMRALAGEANETNRLNVKGVEAFLAQGGSTVLLAEWEGRSVGMLSLSMRANLFHAGLTCTIEELVVEEAARRQGVGSTLLNEAINRARNAGCAEISISTTADNTEAIALYRRLGLVDEAVLLEKHFS